MEKDYRKTTAQALKGESRCQQSGCGHLAAATVTNGVVEMRVCKHHTWTYARRNDLKVTMDSDANLAVCPTCSRAIGHMARAAHTCNG